MPRIRALLEMIKFSHTVFALPFAVLAVVLAGVSLPDPLPASAWAGKLGWVALAMVGARSAAMAFNRLADADIDAANPRTAGRHLPQGALSRRAVAALCALSLALFALAAWMLAPLCLALSPVAAAVILGYSYTKRFTALSHFVLGLALGLAPVGAWIAVTGTFMGADGGIAWEPWALGFAVLLWTAGFDVIYACQDVEHDRRERLHSIPAAIGVAPALTVSAALHVAMVALLGGWFVGWLPFLRPDAFSTLSLIGLAAVAIILVYEHWIVRPHDLSRVNLAFFTLNGAVSLVFAAFAVTDIVL